DAGAAEGIDLQQLLTELPESTSPQRVEPDPDTPLMLLYTSGTTGRSKGVALTHGALAANIGATTRLWRWSATDRLVLALPLFHVHGLGLGVLGTLYHQMSAVVHPRFEAPAVVEALSAGGTIFMGVPTMYARLIAHLEAHPHLAGHLRGARLFTSGSAALPASAHEAFERLTGHRILERYGMSETGFTLSNPCVGERRAGTVGLPVPGYEVRVVGEAGEDCAPGEIGEIWVRGDGLMQGYWQQPVVTSESFTGGWFRTGDVATVSGDGYHQILGRRSADIIKSGGFKISALEIEDVLLRHPSVAEVAVLGLPDPEWGERITAAVVPAQSGRIDPEALSAFVAEHLAPFKRPRAFHVVSSLPRNALGKLQKHRLAVALTAHQ
ncbi:MAG: AMP-binding protein, partial [Myxococcota bacterium]|nr:AMP-binding protein [Myxococcota bacterium]